MTMSDVVKKLKCISEQKGLSDEEREAVLIAVNATNKRIAEKPIKEPGDNLNYLCPDCGKFVGWVDAMAWETLQCCRCGKSIDWNGIVLFEREFLG